LSDIQDSLTSLNEKLDWIIRRLNYLESVLAESQQYPEVASLLRSLKIGTIVYDEPLKTLNRLISVRHLLESVSPKDEMSRIILNAIALKGAQNVSQLSREVQYQRGKSSRTTVRKRLDNLVKNKALVKEGTRYRLPE
jgi:hypothetical protein